MKVRYGGIISFLLFLPTWCYTTMAVKCCFPCIKSDIADSSIAYCTQNSKLPMHFSICLPTYPSIYKQVLVNKQTCAYFINILESTTLIRKVKVFLL